MKKNYHAFTSTIVALLIGTGVSAQAPLLVKDINTTVIGGFISSNPSTGVVLGTNSYFIATDKANGTEIWKTDGTIAGTVLIKDIKSGNGSSNPDNLTVLGSAVYFTADDGINGAELWRTDGTAAGTVMVKDIYTGTQSSSPGNFAKLGGFIYFSAEDNTHGNELWKTDGVNTSLVQDINVGAGSSYPQFITPFGSNIIFSADNGTAGNEPWISNGTTASMVQDIEPGSGSSDAALFCVNGTSVYFRATTSAYGQEPWVSDGTSGGTHIISNMSSGTFNTGLYDFIPLGSNVLISAFVSASPVGNEWYITNGLTISLVKDINPNPYYSGLSGQESYVFGGFVYFGANDGTGLGTELWRTDGTNAGTTLVKDINPGPASASPYYFSHNALNGFIYFDAYNNSDGGELWRTDGTAAGTTEVKNICTGSYDSDPSNFTLLGTQFIFQANTDTLTNSNRELWQTDGTAAGTTLLKNIYPDTVYTASGFQGGSAVNGNNLVFAASQDSIGTELFVSDGTGAGTQLLKNINPGNNNSNPDNFATVGAVTFFTADDGVNGNELWKTDGTPAGTMLVLDISTGSSSSYPGGFNAIGNTLYFYADDGVNGTELWKSDGTPAGTAMVMDINSGGSSYAAPLATLGGYLYFSANDGVHGTELWKTDGTVTSMVMDINVGSGDAYPDSYGSQLLGGFMYFQADDGSGSKLWKTNGATTTSVSVDMPNAEFVVLGTRLFFTGSDATNGEELWYTDGTTTALVTDINAGSSDSSPQDFAVAGNAIYFTADDGSTGKELWKTDGTAAGTVLVKDINAGSSDAYIQGITALNGRVFFQADDGIDGSELWESFGTAVSTTMIDMDPSSYSSVYDFAVMNGTLYFGGHTNLNGTELWKLTPSTAILTGSVSSSYCKGAPVSVPFEALGTINSGNIYTAQLSDATGSFAAPVNIGTLTSTVSTGSVGAVIPGSTPAGSAYRVRVTSTNVAATGYDNGSDFPVYGLPAVSASSSNTLTCSSQTVTLNASGASTYSWSNSASGATITVNPGSTTVYTVTGTDANGCANTAVVTQSVSTCAGIDNLAANGNLLNIYPNPATGLFNVETTSAASIYIYNTLGTLILSQVLESGVHQVNLSNQAPGIYIAKVISGGKLQTVRLVKE